LDKLCCSNSVHISCSPPFLWLQIEWS
jgi:hypothetical protein